MILLLVVTLGMLPQARPQTPGQRVYATGCAPCHGGNGEGGERGPSITARVPLRSDAELEALVRDGLPAAGMPPMALPAAEMKALISHVRTLLPRTAAAPPRFPVVDPARSRDWPTYHGDLSGNRHSPLDQIHAGNVAGLRVAWIYPLTGSQRLEVTPVVIGGVMYVTAVNEIHAIDAASGNRLWQYRRPRTRGVTGDAAGGINRGVAIHGDRLFMVTDHAHLLALNRMNGALLWDVEMADFRQNYGATAAPLVAGDLVLSGISGGDEGVRGFLDAYRISTGQRAWRFWTIPAPGEPLAETWQGAALPHGCAATWMTGTYDPALDLLYWTTGNPCPDYNGDERKGDNLYSDSVLAIRPKTGELAWYFQFTPHDLHDWDAQQTPMLIDAEYRGRPRKLLAQANRNGFFYVLDRANGEFLSATPFVNKLTWANEISKDGRPVVNPDAAPTPQGVKACPAVEGATNWFSTAYSPLTRLFYVQTLEKCSVYSKAPAEWEAGKSHYGGTTHPVAGEPGEKILRALDLETGKTVWERRQAGPANSWGGALSTAGGVVFFGEDDGSFSAADAKTGGSLWRFPANALWKASPMTYQVDGRQYVAVAGPGVILSFSLPAAPQTIGDFRLPPKSVFDASMPRYPNVWFYLDASLAASHKAAVDLVTQALRKTMRLPEFHPPFDNPEGCDFEVRLEHLQPWVDRGNLQLQHAHAFHMRYYHSALERRQSGKVQVGGREYWRFAASVHYEVEHANPHHADVAGCPICGRTGEYGSLKGNLVEQVHDPLGLELLLTGKIRGQVVKLEDWEQRPVGSIGDMREFRVSSYTFPGQQHDRNTYRLGVVVLERP